MVHVAIHDGSSWNYGVLESKTFVRMNKDGCKRQLAESDIVRLIRTKTLQRHGNVMVWGTQEFSCPDQDAYPENFEIRFLEILLWDCDSADQARNLSGHHDQPVHERAVGCYAQWIPETEATELVTKHRNIEFGLSTEEVMPRTPASQRSPAAKTFPPPLSI